MISLYLLVDIVFFDLRISLPALVLMIIITAIYQYFSVRVSSKIESESSDSIILKAINHSEEIFIKEIEKLDEIQTKKLDEILRRLNNL